MFIIDFDDTLFNTRGKGGFKEARNAELAKFGVGEEIYKETYLEARNHADGRCLYSNERHAEALSQRGFDKQVVLGALEKTTGERLKDFLALGAIEFLEDLKKFGQPMILLSLGDPEFQYLKVRGCDIEKYFDRTFMVTRKNVEVLEELFSHVHDDEIWFINDKVDETKELHKRFPEMKVILKVSTSISLEKYKKSDLPNFETLKGISEYVKESR